MVDFPFYLACIEFQTFQTTKSKDEKQTLA